jgi:hypothetical protein
MLTIISKDFYPIIEDNGTTIKGRKLKIIKNGYVIEVEPRDFLNKYNGKFVITDIIENKEENGKEIPVVFVETESGNCYKIPAEYSINLYNLSLSIKKLRQKETVQETETDSCDEDNEYESNDYEDCEDDCDD